MSDGVRAFLADGGADDADGSLKDFQSVVASMTSWQDEGEVEADEWERADAAHSKRDGAAVDGLLRGEMVPVVDGGLSSLVSK